MPVIAAEGAVLLIVCTAVGPGTLLIPAAMFSFVDSAAWDKGNAISDIDGSGRLDVEEVEEEEDIFACVSVAVADVAVRGMESGNGLRNVCEGDAPAAAAAAPAAAVTAEVEVRDTPSMASSPCLPLSPSAISPSSSSCSSEPR